MPYIEWEKTSRNYYVMSREGNICIETASCRSEAVKKAQKRPGFESGVKCREQLEIERQRGYMPWLWEEENDG